IMWRNVGIRREAAGLTDAAKQVEFWDRYVSTREFHTVEGWELQNMLLVAQLMIASAQKRTESRGVHYRSDFPETDDDQASHITISLS
ncbi:MAG: L-aspartate oxidase, partial [Planctomycetaceae bacterium]|nr:L-aspartate oxidase [Planctomycetaceae bacterium]